MNALQAKYLEKPSSRRSPRLRPKRRLPARIAIFLAKFFGVLILLCIVAVAGGAYWLCTPSAEKLILDQATKLLAAQGLELNASRLSGPLPQRLVIEDLSLADAQGQFLKATRVELRLNLSALLGKTVSVETVDLREPEIFRLPVLPPSPEEETPPESGGSFALPVNIDLASLHVQDGLLHGAVLQPAAGRDSPVFGFSLSGNASLYATNLSVTLRGDLRYADHTGVSLNLGLKSGLDSTPGVADDTLDLDVAGLDLPGGLLSLLLIKPDLPALQLTLSGKGGLRDWHGKLSLLAGQASGLPSMSGTLAGVSASGPATALSANSIARPDVLGVNMDLGLKCADGSLWKDIVLAQTFSASLKAEAISGRDTPPSLVPVLGERLNADAELTAAGERFSLTATVNAPSWNLSILDTAIWPDGGEPQGGEDGAAGDRSFQASIRASVTDAAALMAAPEHDASVSSFPVRSSSATADLSGVLSSAASTLNVHGSLETQTHDRVFKTAYVLNAQMEKQHIALSKFELRGLGVTATAAADVHADTGAVQARADIHAPDGAEWQVLLSELAGFGHQPGADAETRSPLGGELRLNASLDLPGTAVLGGEASSAMPPGGAGDVSGALSVNGEEKPGSGNLHLTASNMRWPTPQLAAIFGSSAKVSVKLSEDRDGLGADAWSLILEELRAGILTASGKAVLTPPSGESGVFSPVPASPGALEGELKAGVADLAPLGAGLSGTLQASAQTKGPLDALHVLLSLDSSSLTTPNGVFRGLSLRLDAKTNMTQAAAPAAQAREMPGSGHTGTGNAEPGQENGAESAAVGKDMAAGGTLTLKAADSPGGPLSLSGHWQAGIPVDGRDITASINDFLVQGAGLRISASLAATIPGQTPGAPSTPVASGEKMTGAHAPAGASPPLSIKGELNAEVREWQKIAALAGAPLSGGPAHLRLHLDNAGGAQSASLDLSLQSLALKDKGGNEASFSVENVSAALRVPHVSLDGADPLASLSPDFRLSTGKGLAGPLRWSGGDGVVKGSGGAGEFSLSLLQDTRNRARAGKTGGKGKQAQRTGQTGASGSNAAETLGLRGRYDLIRHEAVINTFALQSRVRPSSGGASQSGPNTGRGGKRVGFQLQKPLTVNYADGLRLSGLDMVFQPGGRFTADAVLTPGALKAKLELRSLPYSFFSLFTNATLPSGELQASADISSTSQGPCGTLTVKTHISSAGTQTGLIKDGAPTRQATAVPASGAAFDLEVNASLASAPGTSAVPGSGVRSIPGIVWLNGSGVFGKATASGSAKEGDLAFQIPLRLGANGIPTPDGLAPMAASVHWNGPLENLWQAVPLPDRYLSGQSLVDVTVTGSMNKPKPTLAAYIGHGRFEDTINGILLTDINLEARTSPEGNLRALLAAKDSAKGTLAVEAQILGLLGTSPQQLAVRGQINGLNPLHRDDLSIGLSGIFGVKGTADAPEVTADIQVDHGELIVSSQLGGSVPILDVTSGSLDDPPDRTGQTTAADPEKTAVQTAAETSRVVTSAASPQKKSVKAASREAVDATQKKEPPELPAIPGPSLNMHISVPRQFYIRGMGIDSEWAGDLRINGPGSNPSLTGALNPVRGYVDLLSKTFTITGGEITFTGGMRINPLLNLELTYTRPDLTAIITAAGTAQKPKLILDSHPPLPQDERLDQILFGKRTSELSRFEAIQLANSLRELTNFGGSSLDVLTNLRKKTGLDVLRVGSEQQANTRTTSGQSGEGDLGAPQSYGSEGEGAPSLEAGKYINDSIYVGVEQGLTPESTAVRVEIELDYNFSLQGQSSSTASEIGIGWKKDY